MLRLLLACALLLPHIAGAGTAINPASCQRIAIGPGPDDMYLQNIAAPRLIISSHDRRHFRSHGNIYALPIDSLKANIMTRTGEPDGFALRPHGLDLIQRDERWWLYVINHDKELFSDQHTLVIYEVIGDTLAFQQELQSPLLTAPNDVAVADNGDIYVTNEREDGASIAEFLFLQRKANVVVYRPQNGWRVATDDLAVANGILIQGNTVWITQTLGEGLRRYQRAADGRLIQMATFGNLSLLDSIHVRDNGHFLIPAYPSLPYFLWHWQSPGRRSPTKIYDVDPQTGQGSILFADNGSTISAVSAALTTKDQLYLGQVFDAFVLRCPLTP
ncbi:MAG: hypothetical protein V4730_05870 [Pseudomonadota bacterium]